MPEHRTLRLAYLLVTVGTLLVDSATETRAWHWWLLGGIACVFYWQVWRCWREQ